MPRHTKAYYAQAAETNTGTMKFTDSSGWTKGNCTSRIISTINDGKATYESKQRGSANMQTNLQVLTKITLQNIVDNYEAFAEMKVHIYSSQDPQGFWYNGAETKNDGVTRLSSLLF
jgi:hypothetical protein